jgi:proline iminopeptidase
MCWSAGLSNDAARLASESVAWTLGSATGRDTGLMDATAQKPFSHGLLDVGEGHVLFDEFRHRVVLFDQRASGRSTPHASTEAVDWSSIDMAHHISDIEQLRQHLGFERWMVVGLSWGSVLALTYAERHPESVLGIVVGAVSTGTRSDIDWLTIHAGRYFPADWEKFRSHVPTHLRDLRIVDAYYQLLMDRDRSVRDAAAAAWCRWEDAHVATHSGAVPNPRYEDEAFRLGFARQVTHCWRHDSWLEPGEIVGRAHRLDGIPGWLIQGRLDISGPLDGAWHIHRAWPGSHLVVIDDEGHGGNSMKTEIRRALIKLVSLTG